MQYASLINVFSSRLFNKHIALLLAVIAGFYSVTAESQVPNLHSFELDNSQIYVNQQARVHWTSYYATGCYLVGNGSTNYGTHGPVIAAPNFFSAGVVELDMYCTGPGGTSSTIERDLTVLALDSADGDSMSDTWETAFGLDAQSDDSSGDYDNDGVSNIDEYTMGLDPTEPRPGLSYFTLNNTSNLTVQAHEEITAQWASTDADACFITSEPGNWGTAGPVVSTPYTFDVGGPYTLEMFCTGDGGYSESISTSLTILDGDLDGDGISDATDTDDDDDGSPDILEISMGTDPLDPDSFVVSKVGFDDSYVILRKSGTDYLYVYRPDEGVTIPGVSGFYIVESGGEYIVSGPATLSQATAAGYTSATSYGKELRDFNGDGYRDLLITGLTDDQTNSHSDTIIYSGTYSGATPLGLKELDQEFEDFFEQLSNFLIFPYWFEWDAYWNKGSYSVAGYVINTYMPVDYLTNYGYTEVFDWDGIESWYESSTEPDECSPTEILCQWDSQYEVWETYVDYYVPIILIDYSPYNDHALDVSWPLLAALNLNSLVACTGDAEDIESAVEAIYEIIILGGVLSTCSAMPHEAGDAGDIARSRLNDLLEALIFFLDPQTHAYITPNIVADAATDAAAVAELNRMDSEEGAMEQGEAEWCAGLYGDPIQVNDPHQATNPPNRCTAEVPSSTKKAIVHTHPPQESSIGKTDERIDECNELFGPEDHIAIQDNGIPNYIKTPSGAIRVLERVYGKYRIRTVSGSDHVGTYYGDQDEWQEGRSDASFCKNNS